MISYEWLAYILTMVFLLWRVFKDYSDEWGGGYINLNGLPNFVWLIVTIVFNLVWGGIYWW